MNHLLFVALISSAVGSLISIIFHKISVRIQYKQALETTDQASEWMKQKLLAELKRELTNYVSWQYSKLNERPTEEDLEADVEMINEYMVYRTSDIAAKPNEDQPDF